MSPSQSLNSSVLELGVGVFAIPEIEKSTTAHLGGRPDILCRSGTMSGPLEDSDEAFRDFFFGPAAGGEHFLSESFSFGGEVQFLYVNEGDTGDVDVSRNRLEGNSIRNEGF